MIIQLNQQKIQNLEKVIMTHDFGTFLGFTSMYRGFEVPNLDNDIKMSLLKRLSTENWRDVPCFTEFWSWFKKKHGTALSQQICKFMFPTDEKNATKMVNCMRNDSAHDWWNHLKARVYKKWCSILTEMQAVYAVVSGSENLNLNWKVIASSELDANGIDFLIITESSAIPVQIKKDSFQKSINHKQNNSENLTRIHLTKKSIKIIEKELEKSKIIAPIEQTLLLKYALPSKGTPAYSYLGHFQNNFVYFDSKKLVQILIDVIEQSKIESIEKPNLLVG